MKLSRVILGCFLILVATNMLLAAFGITFSILSYVFTYFWIVVLAIIAVYFISKQKQMLGILLLVLAGIFLITSLLKLAFSIVHYLLPILILSLGIYLISRPKGK